MAQWWCAFIPSIKCDDSDDHQDDDDDSNDDGNGDGDDDDNDGSGAGNRPFSNDPWTSSDQAWVIHTHTLPAHLQEAQWITGRLGQFG